MSMLPPAFKVSADKQLHKTWHLGIGGPFCIRNLYPGSCARYGNRGDDGLKK
jgi:hypothetical protein